MKRVALIIVIAVFVFGCSKQGTEQKGPFLAKVGSSHITQADFERELASLPDYAQQMFENKEGKEKFLDEIVKKEILYQEALKKGIDKTPDFQKKVEEFRKLTLVAQLLDQEIMSKAKVSDQEVKDYYDKNREKFTTTSQIKASHILVKTEDEAMKLLERLNKGEKFEELARKASIDKKSAENGGNIGFFSRGEVVPEFERAAAMLKVGEISKPVKTPYGYHIIKVTDKKTGPVIEFEKISDMLSQQLAGERQKEVFDKYITDLKKNYPVEIDKNALAKMSEGQDKKEEANAPAAKPEKPATEEKKDTLKAKEEPKQPEKPGK